MSRGRESRGRQPRRRGWLQEEGKQGKKETEAGRERVSWDDVTCATDIIKFASFKLKRGF